MVFGLAVSTLLSAGASAAEQVRVVDDPYEHPPLKEITPAERARARGYSPFAGRKFPTRVLFGDTHNHTMNSGDAFMGGNRLSPEDAYRFARGEEVIASSGVPVKLSRPLDFLVVADHSEGLGVITEVYKGNPSFVSDPTVAKMYNIHPQNLRLYEREGRALPQRGQYADLFRRGPQASRSSSSTSSATSG